MPEIAYVNGKFLPLEQATVPVEDRGYQFADAVYEVVRTYGGRPFALDEHLARLFRSLVSIQLEHHLDAGQLKSLIGEAIQRAGFAETMIYIQISRGVAKRHRGIPVSYEPTFVLTARAMPDSRYLREHGITVITVPDNRWGRCDIKSVALLANVLAYQAARQAGANDAIFVGADDAVCEATAANVFIIRNGELLTPPEGPKILSGITRNKLLEAARAAGIPAAERRITKAELLGADEAFLCSTLAEVVPVLTVDGQKIGTGPLAQRIYERFITMFAS
jgi:D-alanine transaminase